LVNRKGLWMINITEQLKEIRTLNNPSNNTSIQELNVGGFIEFDNSTFKVISMSKYLEVKWSSFKKKKSEYWVTELQLLNLLSGEKSFIEWEFDDELEISKTLSRAKLKDITCDNAPLTRAHLEEISEEEHGSVQYKGVRYHYSEDDTWAALYYPTTESEPLQVRLYEFGSDNEQYLTIELWEDDDAKPEREAFISMELKKKKISILQLEPSGNAKK
jgi:hypothetical protein